MSRFVIEARVIRLQFDKCVRTLDVIPTAQRLFSVSPGEGAPKYDGATVKGPSGFGRNLISLS